jgi:hypothetical protein
MMPGMRSLLLGALLLAVLAAPAAARLPDHAVLTPAGLGPLEVGMTEVEVEHALDRRIRQDKNAGVGGRCGTARIRGGGLLFTDDVLARVSLFTRRFATRSGIRVGDPEAVIREQYGKRAKRSRHTYVDGYYYKVTRGHRRFVFETDSGVITIIHGGRIPEVDYVESCA